MRDIESELKDLLRRMSEEPAPSTAFPSSVRRASLMRRVAAVATGTTLALGVVLAGLSLADIGVFRDKQVSPSTSSARQSPIPPLDEVLALTATVKGPFVIDEDRHRGIPYVFKGRVERQVLPEGGGWVYPCDDFMLGKNERYGGGGSCEIPLARGHEVNYSQNSFGSRPDITAVHGATTPKVDRVTVELDSGEIFEAKMFDVKETSFRFFLVFPEPGKEQLSGQVVAYRGSEVIERVDLCDPDFVATANGTCGP